MIAALNGATYASSRTATIAPPDHERVAGLVAFLLWYIVSEIIGGDFGLSWA